MPAEPEKYQISGLHQILRGNTTTAHMLIGTTLTMARGCFVLTFGESFNHSTWKSLAIANERLEAVQDVVFSPAEKAAIAQWSSEMEACG